MRKQVVDRKIWFAYQFMNWFNRSAVTAHFNSIEVEGRQHLPEEGSFILVANHTCRWDGPVVQHTLKRPSNYMVAPNELKGWRGTLLGTIGAFPADPRLDIVEFMSKQIKKGQGVVIFPEGTIYTDGVTHPFKNGAARIALKCAAANLNVPVIPVAFKYSDTSPWIVRMVLGEPIDVKEYMSSYVANATTTVKNLSTRLHREVCNLLAEMGSPGDQRQILAERPVRLWVPRIDFARNLVESVPTLPDNTVAIT